MQELYWMKIWDNIHKWTQLGCAHIFNVYVLIRNCRKCTCNYLYTMYWKTVRWNNQNQNYGYSSDFSETPSNQKINDNNLSLPTATTWMITSLKNLAPQVFEAVVGSRCNDISLNIALLFLIQSDKCSTESRKRVQPQYSKAHLRMFFHNLWIFLRL